MQVTVEVVECIFVEVSVTGAMELIYESIQSLVPPRVL